MKIALYQSIDHDYESIQTWQEEMSDFWLSEYIQISEPMEVDFIPLKNEEITKQKLVVIGKKIQTVRAVAEATLIELEAEQQELLALPNLKAVS